MSAFCALCLAESGPFSRLPYGKDDALVLVCERCENEHPRMGRLSFSEIRRELPRTGGHHTKRRSS